MRWSHISSCKYGCADVNHYSRPLRSFVCAPGHEEFVPPSSDLHMQTTRVEIYVGCECGSMSIIYFSTRNLNLLINEVLSIYSNIRGFKACRQNFQGPRLWCIINTTIIDFSPIRLMVPHLDQPNRVPIRGLNH